MSSDKKDILKALDKMEAQSDEINSRKAREEARIKKHIKPKAEPTREEIIKKKKEAQDVFDKITLQTYFTIACLIVAGFLGWAWIESKGDKPDFVLLIIIGIGAFGIAYAKIRSGK